MYQCIIPPRIFLAVGVGLLIISLVLGWISFSVPDWLQFSERSGLNNLTKSDSSNEIILQDDILTDFKKFGLWYKCIFSIATNDFSCTLWNKDAPSKFVFIFYSFYVYVSFQRFCSSCSSTYTIWFIIRMSFTFICDY